MLEELVEIRIVEVAKVLALEYEMQPQLLPTALLRVKPLPLVDEARPELFVKARLPRPRVKLSLEFFEVEVPDYFEVGQLELVEVEVIERVHHIIVQQLRVLQFCKLFLLLSVFLGKDLQFLNLLLEDSQVFDLFHEAKQVPAQIF